LSPPLSTSRTTPSQRGEQTMRPVPTPSMARGRPMSCTKACTLSQRDPRWHDAGSVLGCKRDLGEDESPGVEKEMGGRRRTTRRRWCAKPCEAGFGRGGVTGGGEDDVQVVSCCKEATLRQGRCSRASRRCRAGSTRVMVSEKNTKQEEISTPRG
jgi:hypothetical protein